MSTEPRATADTEFAPKGRAPRGTGWIPCRRTGSGRFARAEAALAEPYRGVTTDGQVVPGLFPLRADRHFHPSDREGGAGRS